MFHDISQASASAANPSEFNDGKASTAGPKDIRLQMLADLLVVKRDLSNA